MGTRERIVNELVSEAAERTIRRQLTDAFNQSAQRGDTPRDMVTGGLGSLIDLNGPAMNLLRRIPRPSVTIPLLGSGIGALLSKSDFVDSIPDNGNAGIRQAKTILKTIGPALAIGTSEAIGDVVDRTMGGNAVVPGANQDTVLTALTTVAISREIPGRWFEVYRHGGEIQWVNGDDDAGRRVPQVPNIDWQRAFNQWNRGQTNRTRTVGQGRNRQTVNVPGERFPYELVTLQYAIALHGNGGNDTSVVERLERLLSPKSTWWGRLSDEARSLLLAMSATKVRLPHWDRLTGEDLFEDLPDKADTSALNWLGSQYAVHIQANGALPVDIYEEVKEFFDDFMGSELTADKKMLRTLRQTWRAVRSNQVSIWSLLGGLGWAFALPGLLMLSIIFVYIFFLYHFIFAAMAPAPVGATDAWWFSKFAIMLGSTFTLFVLTSLLRPVESVANVIARPLGLQPEWLIKQGYKINGMLCVNGGLLALMLLFHFSVAGRGGVLAAQLLGFGAMLALQTIGAHGRIYLITEGMAVRLVKFAGFVIALAIIGGVLSSVFGIDFTGIRDVDGTAAATGAFGWISAFVASNILLACIISGLIGLVVLTLIVALLERSMGGEEIEPMWGVRTIAFLIVVACFFIPLAGNAGHNPSQAVPATVTTVVPPVIVPQVTPQTTTPAPVTRRTPVAPARSAHASRGSHTHQTGPSAAECSGLGYDARRTLGCP